MLDETPQEVLEKEIRRFKSFQKTIETREGLYIDPGRKEEIEMNLTRKYNELSVQILAFERAIKILNTQP